MRVGLLDRTRSAYSGLRTVLLPRDSIFLPTYGVGEYVDGIRSPRVSNQVLKTKVELSFRIVAFHGRR